MGQAKIRCVRVCFTKIFVLSEPSCSSQAAGQSPKPPGINMSLLPPGFPDKSSVTSSPWDTEQIARLSFNARAEAASSSNQSTAWTSSGPFIPPGRRWVNCAGCCNFDHYIYIPRHASLIIQALKKTQHLIVLFTVLHMKSLFSKKVCLDVSCREMVIR